MEEEYSGISLREIFKTIFVKKWLVLIVALCITVVGTVGIYLFYSRPQKVYQMNFIISARNLTNPSVMFSYDDGTEFFVGDYVSEETLNAVKAGNKDYADIEVDEIIKEGAVEWSQEITKVSGLEDINFEDESQYLQNKVTFSIKAKYFKDYDQARQFLSDVLYYPTEKYALIDIDYNVYLDKNNFDNALTYSKQLDYISSQIDYLSSLYNALPDIAQDDGTLVAKYRQDFNAWADRQDVSALRTEGTANYYLKDWKTTIAKYENSLVSLRHSLEDAQTKLDAATETYNKLLESGSIIADGSSVTIIDGYKSQVTSLKRQIIEYYNYIASYYEVSNYTVGMDPETYNFNNSFQFVLDGNGNRREITSHITATKAYEEKINALYDEMVNGSSQTDGRSYTDLLKDYSKQVYPRSAKKLIVSGSVVSDGGLGVVTCGLISLVVGVIVACIVGYIVGRQQLKKQDLAVEASAVQPADDDIPMVSSEIQQAAAATDADEPAAEKPEKDKK